MPTNQEESYSSLLYLFNILVKFSILEKKTVVNPPAQTSNMLKSKLGTIT